MRSVLFVAYHYPPQSGSSGLLRSLKFTRYLLDHGWQSHVLSVSLRAYERIDQTQVKEIPDEVQVFRAWALDTKRHLSIGGRYLRWMALPDRWVSWCMGATPTGLRVIRKNNIDVIFTTYPIATAVMIGWILHRLTGKPWVVDFRDYMTDVDYPRDLLTHRVFRWIESKAIQYGSRFIFTAESTRNMYLGQYPNLAPEHCLVIPNGYDEEDFEGLKNCDSVEENGRRAIRLLHAGLLYPEARDPRPFLMALSRLKAEGVISSEKLRIELRAPGSEDYYHGMIEQLGVKNLVHLLPALPYRESLQEGSEADGLLLFQGEHCNNQIPAKAYEYLRLGKPILALTTEKGDTARLLRESGGATILDIADEELLYRRFPLFLAAVKEGKHPLPNKATVCCYDRRRQAEQLAICLSQVVA